MLRLIEEIDANDDQQMQNDFKTYDRCSGKSFFLYFGMKIITILSITNNKVDQTNVRLLLTFTNAAVTKLRPSQKKFSPAQKETPLL